VIRGPCQITPLPRLEWKK